MSNRTPCKLMERFIYDLETDKILLYICELWEIKSGKLYVNLYNIMKISNENIFILLKVTQHGLEPKVIYYQRCHRWLMKGIKVQRKPWELTMLVYLCPQTLNSEYHNPHNHLLIISIILHNYMIKTLFTNK